MLNAENRLKALIVACFVALGSAGVSGQSAASADGYFSGISKDELELLMADVAKSNPKVLERLAQDAEMRKSQIENLRQLFAYASEALSLGLTKEPINRQELENIRNEVLAVNYDREVNKDKAKLAPFGLITKGQVLAFSKSGPTVETEFDAFLNAKLELVKAGGKATDITEDEKAQSRDFFAKIRIYTKHYEAKVKAGLLSKTFIEKANLQVKLQQAQFLARLVSEKVAGEFSATDAEISKYIQEHSELDPRIKRAKAQEILDRAKAGESFIALADEFSEDPGNVGTDGKKIGGIYTDIPEGRMVAPFEKAALALIAGQISPELVETDFGFHVIKLEKKGLSKDPAARGTQVYDARHILISTSVDNPQGRSVPLKDHVREEIESTREAEYIERLVAEHKIQVPEDFDIPKMETIAETKPLKKKPVSRKKPVKKRK